MKFWLLFSMFFFNHVGVLCDDKEPGILVCNTPELLENWMKALPSKYKRHIAPPPKKKRHPRPIVTFGMYVNRITAFDMINGEFQVDFKIEMLWKDARINMSDATYIIPKEFALKIWYPKIKFKNCVKCRKIQVQPKSSEIVWDSSILYIASSSIENLPCTYNLENFPMDTQKCSFQIVPVFPGELWLRNSYHEFLDKNSPSDLNIVNLEVSDCHEGNISSPQGKACIEYTFILQRGTTFYLLCAYLPTALLVLVSWISFFIDIKDTQARTSISLSCFITIISNAAAVQLDLPDVPYLKALDIYLLYSYFHIGIFSILPTIIMIWSSNLPQPPKLKRSLRSMAPLHVPRFYFFVNDTEREQLEKPKGKLQNLKNWIRKKPTFNTVLMITYIVVYVVFNIIYWNVYKKGIIELK